MRSSLRNEAFQKAERWHRSPKAAEGRRAVEAATVGRVPPPPPIFSKKGIGDFAPKALELSAFGADWIQKVQTTHTRAGVEGPLSCAARVGYERKRRRTQGSK